MGWRPLMGGGSSQKPFPAEEPSWFLGGLRTPRDHALVDTLPSAWKPSCTRMWESNHGPIWDVV